MIVKIYCLDSPENNVELQENEAVVIGRNPDEAGLVIQDRKVSRSHAILTHKLDGSLIIKNISKNNSVSIEGREVNEGTLKPGMSFSLANVQLKVILVENTKQKESKSHLFDRECISIATGEKITIGRGLHNDIAIRSTIVSRQHAEIKKISSSKFQVVDLKSTNGTFYNGKKIARKELRVCESIIIGPTQIHLKESNIFISEISTKTAIVSKNLTRILDNGITILQSVNISIQSNKIIALMGPSGCGKTTLLNALCGFKPANYGQVNLFGLDLYKNYGTLKPLIGYVPQADIVHSELTVWQSLLYTAKLRFSSDVSESEITNRINKVLSQLKIAHIKNSRISHISGGQRKRVSIAVELLSAPPILFLDEPTSPLDPQTIEDFMAILKEFTKDGITIVMVTHKPEDLEFVDEVLFMAKGGKLAYAGNTKDYLKEFALTRIHQMYKLLESGEVKTQPIKQPSKIESQTLPKIPNGAGFWKQLTWLTLRLLNIKINDRINSLILLLQAPVIAVLVGIIFRERTIGVLFIMALTGVWFGTSNSAREITSERPIFLRERMFNLQLWPYVLSKILVMGLLCLIQSILFVIVLNFFISLPSLPSIIFNMFLVSLTGVTTGLILSGTFDNSEKVMSLVPLVLIPQILLSGVLARLSNPILNTLSYLTVTRWGTEALANLVETVFVEVKSPRADTYKFITKDAIDLLLFKDITTYSQDIKALCLILFVSIIMIPLILFTKERYFTK